MSELFFRNLLITHTNAVKDVHALDETSFLAHAARHNVITTLASLFAFLNEDLALYGNETLRTSLLDLALALKSPTAFWSYGWPPLTPGTQARAAELRETAKLEFKLTNGIVAGNVVRVYEILKTAHDAWEQHRGFQIYSNESASFSTMLLEEEDELSSLLVLLQRCSTYPLIQRHWIERIARLVPERNHDKIVRLAMSPKTLDEKCVDLLG